MVNLGRSLTSDEIVIDPMVEPAARRALADLYSAGRPVTRQGPRSRPGSTALAARPRPAASATASAGGRLIPFRESPPRVPPRPAPTAARNAKRWGACAAACLIATLLAALAGSIGFVVILLIGTAIATAGGVRSLFDASSASREWAQTQWVTRYAAAAQHRRYVVPPTDLDDEARPVWARAVAAANEVNESYVVERHIVDSVQVATALPQRLWEIVEGFARLSEVRGRQREILRQRGTVGQPVAAMVSAQDRAMKVEARRLEGRVRKLEEIAGLLREADTKKRSEETLGELGELNELLGDLRARSAGAALSPDPAEQLKQEVQAVIDQANAAARDLFLPDLGEEDDRAAEDDEAEDDA
jgi:hypothetical protein